MGTPAEVFVGKVRVERKDRTVRVVDVVKVGKPFSTAQGQMVYGYLAESVESEPKPAPAPVPEPVRAPVAPEPESAMEDVAF